MSVQNPHWTLTSEGCVKCLTVKHPFHKPTCNSKSHLSFSLALQNAITSNMKSVDNNFLHNNKISPILKEEMHFEGALTFQRPLSYFLSPNQ